jgi:hypothetical protein
LYRGTNCIGHKLYRAHKLYRGTQIVSAIKLKLQIETVSLFYTENGWPYGHKIH